MNSLYRVGSFPVTQNSESVPSFKTFGFATLIVFGVGSLIVAAVGTGGLLHASVLTNLGQVNSITMIVIGAGSSIPLLVVGIVGFVNTYFKKRISNEQIESKNSLDIDKETKEEVTVGSSKITRTTDEIKNSNTVQITANIPSTENSDIEEISTEILNSIQPRDIYTLLQINLQKASACLMDKRNILNDEFNNAVWIWAIYQIILDATLDEETCHPLLYIGDCCVKDAVVVKQDSVSCNTSDWFSTDQSPCYPVVLKKKANGLSSLEKSMVCHAIECNETADQKVLEIIIGLREIANQLQFRYPFFATGNNFHPLIYSGFEDTTNFLPNIIFELLKKIIINYTNDVNTLSNLDHAKRICSMLVVDLLALAKIDNINHCLYIEKLKIQFGSINRDSFFDSKIPNFLTNDLTSFSYEDSTVVDTQPLDLAIVLSKMNEKTFVDLREKIKCGEKIEAQIATLLYPISELILDRYYKNFMSNYLQKYQATHQFVQKTINSEPSEKLVRSKNQKIPNDIFGDTLKSLIEKNFDIHFSWSLSGSCVLSAMLLVIEPRIDYSKDTTAGYERVQQIRDQLADYLHSKEKEFVEYFTTADDFHMHLIHLRGKSYLDDIDLLALAQVLERPLLVYKRKTESFFITETGLPLPSFNFGTNLSGEPIHLYDDHDHFKLITFR